MWVSYHHRRLQCGVHTRRLESSDAHSDGFVIASIGMPPGAIALHSRCMKPSGANVLRHGPRRSFHEGRAAKLVPEGAGGGGSIRHAVAVHMTHVCVCVCACICLFS